MRVSREREKVLEKGQSKSDGQDVETQTLQVGMKDGVPARGVSCSPRG